MTRATRADTSPVPSSRNTEVMPSLHRKNLLWEKNSGARPTQTSKDLTFNSNDLPADALGRREVQCGADAVSLVRVDGRGVALDSWADPGLSAITEEIGRASCRER